MTSLQHNPFRRPLAALALVAMVLLAALPLLTAHHHHEDLQQSARCGLCVLASGQVTPQAIQPLPDNPRLVIDTLDPITDSIPATPQIVSANPRAPPVV